MTFSIIPQDGGRWGKIVFNQAIPGYSALEKNRI
jgi:hypothetical protein